VSAPTQGEWEVFVRELVALVGDMRREGDGHVDVFADRLADLLRLVGGEPC
jgi:hypothetical protein